MDITPLISKDAQVITHYGNGGFVINGTAHKGNILLLPGRVVPWNVQEIAKASRQDFAEMLNDEVPEILLVGAGSRFTPLAPGFREFFREKGIAVDVMDTGAACRTYTVLLAEGRQVAAALIAV